MTARRVASVPARTSTATWHAIIDLVAPLQGPARSVLSAATGVCAAIISEEYTRDAPIIIRPASGPQIRIYTVHGEDALEVLQDETPLSVQPLADPQWTLSVPCGVDDIDDFGRVLAGDGRISLRDLTAVAEIDKFAEPQVRGSLTVNLEELS
ncbi:conserved hypothetical protein [Catenulispora acidiphila DSM 44928]|uniref:Uncharacterized protein n=1 Tax=Catenulispora acidiphila (strain DSM 44928 / JCM 14897 / NBRC 102108 / NRRL B-24433 / ID139908) TaxID=479433 RepID=C7Q3J6_CATAD|nr:conserved hypothetical protein [Catenulispora acidiphila DSM 44928]